MEELGPEPAIMAGIKDPEDDETKQTDPLGNLQAKVAMAALKATRRWRNWPSSMTCTRARSRSGSNSWRSTPRRVRRRQNQDCGRAAGGREGAACKDRPIDTENDFLEHALGKADC
ncbi:protein of unknown function (plasmid) [Cupriavidus neocaledonicus]|uniref:Uncharacterized protein n=1 Tax=Cupriavidus neocaledonicus TaxID=1040979 RepID=A0A375HX61_9BURK|nr:protein of unknown function [Cupriavidus neocaledonicus]